MGTPREPAPVKIFAGLLCNDPSLFPLVQEELAARIGPVDCATPILPWKVTAFYEKEMGSGLLRRFVSHTTLTGPGRLAEIKGIAQELEDRHRRKGEEREGRRVNIDPGYIEASKVVLATSKNAAHRVYLASGIYGEATLAYRDGAYREYPYTYPDYRWPQALAFFAEVRAIYLRQLKQEAITGH